MAELEKPSLLNSSSLFASINIVICDPDASLSSLVKNILSTLGCNRIFTVSDGQDVLNLMKEEKVDIVITDWQMKGLNGIDLATYLRQSLESPNRMIPIVMLTSRNSGANIRTARDAGISEYIVKPFSAKTLLERVYAVVQEPRSFIICKTYIGPDRRRISSMSLPPDPDAEHTFIERKPALIVHKDQLKQLILDDIPRMIMPDYSLKKKLGFEVPQELVINPMALAKSEEEIKNVQENFVQTMLKDVDLLQKSYTLLVQHPEHGKKLVKTIQDTTESIKSRAGIFGYIRATEVAQQLYNFCNRYYDKDNKYHLIILEKHIQTLAVIFGNKITGDGGELGAELLRDLARLINKYLKRP